MKKQFFWTVFLIFAIGLFFTVGLNALVSPQEDKKTPLAGTVSFPAVEYNEWLKVQVDSSVKDADKVACTINAFFDLKLKSWVKLELQDFGFLFDRKSASGEEDYRYERGLYYLMLFSWRELSTPPYSLASYKYEPKYSQLVVDKDTAKAKMSPYATIVYGDGTGDGEAPWTEHTFNLIHKNDLWLIKNVLSDDEMRQSFPHGTDFVKEIKQARKKYKKWLDDQKIAESELMKDPKKQEILLKRWMQRKMQKDGVVVPLEGPGGGYKSYMGYAAAAYASLFSSNDEGDSSYNHLFVWYPGHDCANFASQCVWFGCGGDYDNPVPIENHDIPMIDDGVPVGPDDQIWWADSEGSDSGNNWANVTELIHMITNNYNKDAVGPQGFPMPDMRFFGRGSLIVHSPRNKPKHVMIFSSWIDWDGDGWTDFNEIYISAHTTNRHDKRLKDLLLSYFDLSYYEIIYFHYPD